LSTARLSAHQDGYFSFFVSFFLSFASLSLAFFATETHLLFWSDEQTFRFLSRLPLRNRDYHATPYPYLWQPSIAGVFEALCRPPGERDRRRRRDGPLAQCAGSRSASKHPTAARSKEQASAQLLAALPAWNARSHAD